MARRLPTTITKDEFNLLLDEAKKQREKYRAKRSKKLSPYGERINEYMIAMILGAQAGMRISEICGLRAEISKCCQEDLIEIKEKNEKGNTVKLKQCAKCNKKYKSSEFVRSNKKWDIEPLTPNRVLKDRIEISQGKGEKDRWVWRPKLINNEAVNKLPLTFNRRSLQYYFQKLCKKVLNKDLSFHSLRHHFATEYYKKFPGDIKTLQVLMGHSRIDTTAIYSHVAIDDALDKVKEVF